MSRSSWTATASGMRCFLVCIHDATPAYDRETRVMIQDLAPLLGRRLSVAVVPNWHGEWPLAAHPDYCRLVRESSEELLLHGYFHQRRRGWGPIALLAGSSDEMNGLGPDETRRTLDRGQRVFTEVFGAPARGFLAPAWQRRHVCLSEGNLLGLDHVLGFFSLESRTGRKIPLATWTWDCGRWRWLGNVGHGIGRLLQLQDRRVPTLAIHPADLERGFWPDVLRLTQRLIDAGYEPITPAALLEPPERGHESQCERPQRASTPAACAPCATVPKAERGVLESACPPMPWRRRERACQGVRWTKSPGENRC